MINYNLLLYSLLDRKMSIDFNGGNYIVNYTEGDLFELQKKLSLSSTKYPIIWLQSGYSVVDNQLGDNIELKDCFFFLITKGDEHDLYKKRFESNYQSMLFPIYKEFKNVFRKQRGIEITNDKFSFTTLPFNDVSELSSRDSSLGRKRNFEGGTITDIWDALVIKGINLKINKNCFNEFKI